MALDLNSLKFNFFKAVKQNVFRNFAIIGRNPGFEL
jgi:hypothetical protein